MEKSEKFIQDWCDFLNMKMNDVDEPLFVEKAIHHLLILSKEDLEEILTSPFYDSDPLTFIKHFNASGSSHGSKALGYLLNSSNLFWEFYENRF